MINGIIYKATNKINGKVYIGQTIKLLKNRKYSHKSDALKNRYDIYFHRAIRKYGFDNFEWSILCKTDSVSKLNALEKFYIAAHRKMGKVYNQTDGGDGTNGYKLSEESKTKMSKAKKGKYIPWNKGVKYPPELCKKFSEAQIKSGNNKGEKNPMYGVHLVGEKNPMYGKKRPDTIKRNLENNPAKREDVKARKSMQMKEYWKNNYEKGIESRKKATITRRDNLLKAM
jgi:group I intron endonuclease